MIESSTNGQIKKIQKLNKNARFRKKENLFVAEGWKMTEEALRRGLVRAVYVSESAESVWEERLSALAAGVPVETVKKQLFRELSDTVTPQGVLALVEIPRYDREKVMASEDAVILCLEDIQDPGNLGTIVRTAEGAGVSGIVLSGGCADLFNPKVVRSTMGSLFRVPYFVTEDMTTEVELLKNEGFTMYAAHLQGEREYSEETYVGRVGILIGNEANGLSDEVSGMADKRVRIPMDGELESLNAAVSAALLMYEARRNRG